MEKKDICISYDCFKKIIDDKANEKASELSREFKRGVLVEFLKFMNVCIDEKKDKKFIEVLASRHMPCCENKLKQLDTKK